MTYCGQVIVPFSNKDLFIKMSTRAENLSNLAIDKFPRHGFFSLLAHSHLTTGLKKFPNVIVCCMKRDSAHGSIAALG